LVLDLFLGEEREVPLHHRYVRGRVGGMIDFYLKTPMAGQVKNPRKTFLIEEFWRLLRMASMKECGQPVQV